MAECFTLHRRPSAFVEYVAFGNLPFFVSDNYKVSLVSLSDVSSVVDSELFGRAVAHGIDNGFIRPVSLFGKFEHGEQGVLYHWSSGWSAEI